MSAPPFMPLYVADYLADTTHLTTLEHGAYCLLLMASWRLGGSLPDDDAKLAKFARMTAAQWARVRESVIPFFDVSDGVVTQRRLLVEIEKHAGVVRRRRESGSMGGKAKALKNNVPAIAGANFLLEQNLANQNQNQNQKKESPLPPKGEKKKGSSKGTTIPDGFPDTAALQVGREMVLAAGVAVHVRTESEKFRDYALGRGGAWRKADWLATWRNWIRSACERAPSLGIAFSPTPAPDNVDPWPARIREWQRSGDWKSGDWGPPPDSPKTEVAARYLKECLQSPPKLYDMNV